MIALIVGVATLLLATSATAAPCEVPDNGSGTVDLPPAGCEYIGDGGVYLIVDGLPPGTTIEMVPTHKNFMCTNTSQTCSLSIPGGLCEISGGLLGGDGACAQAEVELRVTGTGALAGFSRVMTVPLDWEAHSGPRIPGNAVQTFPTEMIQMQGEISGDPDFEVIRLRAGSGLGLGLAGPGSTTLTELPSGDWNVDSFFDLTYEIDFQGAPGGVLDGLGGTTQDTIRIRTGFAVAAPLPVPALTQVVSAMLAGSLLLAGTLLGLRRRRAED